MYSQCPFICALSFELMLFIFPCFHVGSYSFCLMNSLSGSLRRGLQVMNSLVFVWKRIFFFQFLFFLLLWIKPRASDMLGKYCVAENSSSLFEVLFLFMCMSVFLVCMCIVCIQCSLRPEEGTRSKELGYRNCKVPDIGARNWTHTLFNICNHSLEVIG